MTRLIISERETNTHLFFLRGVFSNFQLCEELEVRGMPFMTTEHAFMWLKAKHFKDERSATKILTAMNPSDAKLIGRGVVGFNVEEWSQVCFDYMLEVNRAKYSQNPDLALHLVKTGNKILAETNGKDVIWGIGLYADNDKVLNEKTWKGKNLLGQVLMKVRQELNEGSLNVK